MIALLFLLGSGGSDLAKAIQELGRAGSYQFTRTATNAAVEGTYQKESPVFLRADRMDFFRQGDKLVYKQGNSWLRTRTGTLSDPLPILGASAKVRAARLPHEELAKFGKALTTATEAKEEDRTVYTAELDAATARELAAAEDRDLARGGTARLWLHKGRLTKYEIKIKVQGRRGNADVDGVATTAVTLSAIGTSKIDVPAGAKKALD